MKQTERKQVQSSTPSILALAALLWFAGNASADKANKLDALFRNASTQQCQWSCTVLSVDDKNPTYTWKPDASMIPASNQKLYTVAAALLELGPDYAPTTDYYSTGPVRNGRLQGNLLVRGHGAFDLTGRHPLDDTITHYQLRLNRKLDHLSQQLHRAGIRHVEGRVVPDITGWCAGRRNTHYPSASALLFHDNTIDVNTLNGNITTCPAKRIGFQFEISDTITEQERVQIEDMPTDTIRVNPKVDDHDYWRIEHIDAHRYFTLHLQEALRRRGMTFAGKKTGHTSTPVLLFKRPGLSIARLLPAILGHSDNLCAEVLFLNMGAAIEGQATTPSAAAACTRILRKHGLATKATISDGSGLSRNNLASTRETAQLLQQMTRQPFFQTLHDALAVSGTSGTLKNRLTRTTLKGRIVGKSGSLTGVKSLAGYIQTPRGRQAFAICYNGPPDKEAFWSLTGSALEMLCEAK
jgi:D-alanyl-D-alanine carboxypeptidase/D-alanyl-D-alanine-endopeptidase (penicillin-binding protein 4)